MSLPLGNIITLPAVNTVNMPAPANQQNQVIAAGGSNNNSDLTSMLINHMANLTVQVS